MTTTPDPGFISAMPWPLYAWMLLAGFLLGVFFYGSLWLVTGRILHSSRPVLWVMGGFVLRLGLVLPSLFWLSGGQWQPLLVCMAGFIAARPAVIRLTGKLPLADIHTRKIEEPDHASQPR